MSKKKNKKFEQYEDNKPADQQVEAAAEETAEQTEPVELTPEQERDELMGRLQRLAADYQNYQKRAQKETAQAREFANENLIKQLLPVLDDMERALAAGRENHDAEDGLLTGMQLVHDNLVGVLGKCGLEAVSAMGQMFDPDLHSAMMQQESADVEPMTVLHEIHKGYQLKGRTIRPAAVVVAKAPAGEEGDA